MKLTSIICIVLVLAICSISYAQILGDSSDSSSSSDFSAPIFESDDEDDSSSYEPPLMPIPATDITPIPPASSSVQVNLRLLIVGTSSLDAFFLSAKLTLDSVGAPYDTIFSGSFPQLTSNGVGLYSGIIVAVSAGLDYQLDSFLQEYQQLFGVRRVVLFAAPLSPGMQPKGLLASQEISFRVQAGPYTKGVQLSFTDSPPLMYIANVLDPLIATPMITGRLLDATETVVAAVIQNLGTKRLEFYVSPLVGSGYTLALGNIWLQWITDGAFIGLRRIIWNIQVDDMLLSTNTFDPATANLGSPYRATPTDIINLENVQKLVNEYVPGSNIRVELAFNGAGATLGGGYSTDPLYLELKKRKDSFYFESHTFTHPGLDTYTYDQTVNELVRNIETASDLFGTTSSTLSYSSRAMISGLFNGEVLRAIASVGITTVVGDNSRPELTPANKYHGIYTSAAVHGYAGIYIVPRHVSDIFYDCSTPQAEEAQYNLLYKQEKPIRDIVLIQAKSASEKLMAYRHDPFMFHQANLGTYTMTISGQLKTTSLIDMWIANTFSQIIRFSTLPYLSFKHEDLAEVWKQREARDNCGVTVSGTMNANKQISGLTFISTNSCRYAITGINVIAVAGVTTTESYGPDVTTWINLVAGVPLQLSLTSPISL